MFHWNEAAGTAFLLNLAVKSTALLAAAWLAAFALRRQSAAARHMIWMATFAALLGLKDVAQVAETRSKTVEEIRGKPAKEKAAGSEAV